MKKFYEVIDVNYIGAEKILEKKREYIIPSLGNRQHDEAAIVAELFNMYDALTKA